MGALKHYDTPDSLTTEHLSAPNVSSVEVNTP